MLKLKKRGRLIVISSPSGAGKSSLARKLTYKNPLVNLSVSLTTRKPRINEFNGIHYDFVSRDSFKIKIKKNLFLEHAKVFGNYYGTLKSKILKQIRKGNDILLDIDWQGARQVKKKLPKDTLTIFILPPSLMELKKRLKKRGESNYFVKKRMSKAKAEIKHWVEYDYVLVNDKFSECLNNIKSILSLEKFKPSRNYISSNQ